MLREQYYVIRPKATLREKLKLAYPDELELFDNSVLWIQKQADRSPLSPADWQVRLKVVFLVSLMSEYGASMPQLFEDLYGSPPYRADIFETWWELEPVIFEGTVDGISQSVPIELWNLVDETGSESVDDWIQQLIDDTSHMASSGAP
jgi:hypothetical protein